MDGQNKSRKDPPIYGSGPPTVPQTGSLWYLIKPNHSPLEGESQKPSRFPEPVEGPATADAVGGFNP